MTSPNLADGVAATREENMLRPVTLAPLGPGVYELILHLGYDDEEMRGGTFDHPGWGAAWRQWNFDLVRSAEFRDWLKQQGFQLITWRELAKARQ